MAGTSLQDNIRIEAGKPIDDRYVKGTVPYTDVADVNATIVLSRRHKGLTVLIGEEEYWYKAGITNGDLIVKAADTGETYTFENGLEENGGVVTLGGILSDMTVIDAGTNLFQVASGPSIMEFNDGDVTFSTPTKTFFIDTWYFTLNAGPADTTFLNIGVDFNYSGTGSFLVMDCPDIKFTNDAGSYLELAGVTTLHAESDLWLTTISTLQIDAPNGAAYQADYSALYTDRSLVDKGYVDTAIAAVDGGSSGKAVAITYADVDAMFADQAAQQEDLFYLVIDASADPTVGAGWALYQKLIVSTPWYDDYRKIAEFESLDSIFPNPLTADLSWELLSQTLYINTARFGNIIINLGSSNFGEAASNAIFNSSGIEFGSVLAENVPTTRTFNSSVKVLPTQLILKNCEQYGEYYSLIRLSADGIEFAVQAVTENPTVRFKITLTGAFIVNGDAGTVGKVLTSQGAGSPPTWITPAAAGASNAASVTNTPAGNIAAIDVQAALNELDSEKQSAAQVSTAIAALGLTGVEYGVNSSVISSGTMTLNCTGKKGDVAFHNSTVISSNFTLAITGDTDVRSLTQSVLITGTVEVTMDSDVVMEKIDGRWVNATKKITLIAPDTGNPFTLSFYKVGTLWDLKAGGAMYTS
ncbi:MAG: hypothetical protein WKF87_06790 [Chryseolinea sp.]